MMITWEYSHTRRLLLACLLLVIACTGLTSQSLYAMTYNIRLDYAGDGPDRWDLRKAELTDLLKTLRPEVFGLQEALHHQAEYIDSALTNYVYFGAGRDDGKTKGEYSPIFYDTTKLLLEESRTFWLTEDTTVIASGWDAHYKRVCTYGRFIQKESDRSFWAFNTHFDHVGVEARAESARLIASVADAVNGPVVVMGDFNAVTGEEPIRLLTKRLEDSYAASQSEHVGPPGTWNGFDPAAEIERRIDYIFVHGFVVDSHVHIGMRRKNNRHFSDHLPVLCQLTFK